jgi:FtsH-binding integral membrane protein
MSRVPGPLALLTAVVGGAVTSVVLLVGAVSLTGATTQAHMMSLAGAVVVLPVGLIILAAGFYVARRVYVTLRPPIIDSIDEETS